MIPITNMIVNDILAMTCSHLASASAKLVELGPDRLGLFTMKMGPALHIKGPVFVFAALLVISDMNCWDGEAHLLNTPQQVREVATEALQNLHRPLAVTIVANEDRNFAGAIVDGAGTYGWGVSNSLCRGKISVAESRLLGKSELSSVTSWVLFTFHLFADRPLFSQPHARTGS